MSDSARLAAYGLVLAASLGAGALLGAVAGSPPADQSPAPAPTHSPGAEHGDQDHSEAGAAQS